MPDVTDKAQETTTLKRGELWMLRIAAVAGAFSFISHGTEAVAKLLELLT